MKKQCGFTLLELLAVIVILALIVLIATPIIMNVINDAKEGAAQDSAYGYIKAIEVASVDNMTETISAIEGSYTTKNGDLYQGNTKILGISFKGKKPNDGGTVTLAKGRVTQATLTFDKIKITYNGKKMAVVSS